MNDIDANWFVVLNEWNVSECYDFISWNCCLWFLEIFSILLRYIQYYQPHIFSFKLSRINKLYQVWCESRISTSCSALSTLTSESNVPNMSLMSSHLADGCQSWRERRLCLHTSSSTWWWSSAQLVPDQLPANTVDTEVSERSPTSTEFKLVNLYP